MAPRLTKGESDALNADIQNLRNEEFTEQEIADKLGISQSNVNKRLAAIKQSATSGIIMTGGLTAYLKNNIDPVAQLKDLNQVCWDILKTAITQDDKLAATKEIRSQLDLHVKIFKEIYHAESVKRFQDGVLEALQDAHPDLRKEAIQNINRLKEMAGCVLVDDIGDKP